MVALLIQKGAHIKLRSSMEEASPLAWAVVVGAVDVASMLLEVSIVRCPDWMMTLCV